jgi:hypothetical protein
LPGGFCQIGSKDQRESGTADSRTQPERGIYAHLCRFKLDFFTRSGQARAVKYCHLPDFAMDQLNA